MANQSRVVTQKGLVNKTGWYNKAEWYNRAVIQDGKTGIRYPENQPTDTGGTGVGSLICGVFTSKADKVISRRPFPKA